MCLVLFCQSLAPAGEPHVLCGFRGQVTKTKNTSPHDKKTELLVDQYPLPHWDKPLLAAYLARDTTDLVQRLAKCNVDEKLHSIASNHPTVTRKNMIKSKQIAKVKRQSPYLVLQTQYRPPIILQDRNRGKGQIQQTRACWQHLYTNYLGTVLSYILYRPTKSSRLLCTPDNLHDTTHAITYNAKNTTEVASTTCQMFHIALHP